MFNIFVLKMTFLIKEYVFPMYNFITYGKGHVGNVDSYDISSPSFIYSNYFLVLRDVFLQR